MGSILTFVTKTIVLVLISQANGFNLVNVARLPEPLMNTAAVYDGDDAIYILGGGSTSLPTNNLVIKYSLGNGNWTVPGNFRQVSHGAAVMHGQDILYFGGLLDDESFSSSVYRYSTRTNTYSIANKLAQGTAYLGSSWDPFNQIAYLFGGMSSDFTSDRVYQYHAAADAIGTVARLPEPRAATEDGMDNRRGVTYLFGGLTADGDTRDILKFDHVTRNVTKLMTQLPFIPTTPCVVFPENSDEAYIIAEEGLVKFNLITEQVEEVGIDNWPYLSNFGCAYVPKLGRVYLFGGFGRFFGGGPGYFRDQISYIDFTPRLSLDRNLDY